MVDFETLENVLFTQDTDEDDESEARQREVLEAVLSLKECYREVIHLYYYMDYDTDRISKTLGIPAATVRTRLARARDALEKKLKGGKSK